MIKIKLKTNLLYFGITFNNVQKKYIDAYYRKKTRILITD